MQNPRDAKKYYTVIFFIFTLCLPLYPQIGTIIDPSRRVDWRNPGFEGEIPRSTSHFVNVYTQYIAAGQ